MKKISILTILVFSALIISAAAQLQFVEPFDSDTIYNTYEEFWTDPSDLEVTTPGDEGIADSPEADGYFGKQTLAATGYASTGKVAGFETDSDYTVQAYIYTPVVNTADEPDDYWYQMLIFYRDEGGYCRFHTQFNEDSTVIDNPRIRLQITNPSFAYTEIWESPSDFTHSEGWHFMKAEITGTTADCYFDETYLGTADWTADAATRDAGKFGFGQYIDGEGTRSLYIDMFKAYQGSEPPWPTPTPEPVLGAQNWTHYE